jgi:hypothetical protein
VRSLTNTNETDLKTGIIQTRTPVVSRNRAMLMRRRGATSTA